MLCSCIYLITSGALRICSLNLLKSSLVVPDTGVISKALPWLCHDCLPEDVSAPGLVPEVTLTAIPALANVSKNSCISPTSIPGVLNTCCTGVAVDCC